jgi:large subunit ribosomal protein L29
MKIKELRQKTGNELKAEALRLKRELFKLRMRIATNQLPQVHLIKSTKHQIAIVKTILREQELKGDTNVG